MKYNPPYGSSNPDAPYINATPGQKGSPVPAEAIEYVQREIVNTITRAGLTPSNENLGQLYQALQKAVQGGAYLLPPAKANALGGVMVNKNGLVVDASGLVSLLLLTGGGLGMDSSGRLFVNPYAFSSEILNELLKTLRLPQWLTANKTWYVRTDGSDNNTGESNTASGAFRTIQKALTYISENFNFSSHVATLSIQPGTYEEQVTIPRYSASTGSLSITGGSADTTVLSGCITTLASIGNITINNLTIRNSGIPLPSNSADYLLLVSDGTTLTMSNCKLLATQPLVTANRTIIAQISGIFRIGVGNGITLSAAAAVQNILYASGGQIQLNRSIEVNGHFASAFIRMSGLSRFGRGSTAEPSPVITGSSGGTGSVKYTVTENSICNTSGGGADYFPGENAGTANSGGQYT